MIKNIIDELRLAIRNEDSDCSSKVARVVLSDESRFILEFESSKLLSVILYGTDLVRINPNFANFRKEDGSFVGIPIDVLFTLFKDSTCEIVSFTFVNL